MRSAASLLALAALLALALALLTAVLAQRREAAALRDVPPVGGFVEVDGRRVHYVQAGQGPDVVLIHGASGNLRDMTFDLVGRLAPRYRVTAFDRPGLGYTDRAREGLGGALVADAEGPGEQAALLRAAAAALGVERPVVLGHSFGGAVAMAWGLDFPEATAAVVDVSGATMPWPGGLSGLYRLNASALGGAVAPWLVAAYAPEPMVEAAIDGTFRPQAAPDGYAEHLGAALALRAASFRANARQVNALRPHLVEMSARYPGLAVPLEIVHGAADPIVPAAVHSIPLSRLVPGANLVLLDGVGHMPHHADPDAVVAAVDRAAARGGA